MVASALIDKAVQRLLAAAPIGSVVILFGSHARDTAGPHSDIDLLVVEPEVNDRHGEMVRLRMALGPLPVPADVLVTSAARFEHWRDTPNTVYFDAATEGRRYGPKR